MLLRKICNGGNGEALPPNVSVPVQLSIDALVATLEYATPGAPEGIVLLSVNDCTSVPL
jgi:hypothetical protein